MERGWASKGCLPLFLTKHNYTDPHHLQAHRPTKSLAPPHSPHTQNTQRYRTMYSPTAHTSMKSRINVVHCHVQQYQTCDLPRLMHSNTGTRSHTSAHKYTNTDLQPQRYTITQRDNVVQKQRHPLPHMQQHSQGSSRHTVTYTGTRDHQTHTLEHRQTHKTPTNTGCHSQMAHM